MTADVVILPTVPIERQDDPRAALVEIFGGRVDAENIEIFLQELHRRGFCIATFETDEVAP